MAVAAEGENRERVPRHVSGRRSLCVRDCRAAYDARICRDAGTGTVDFAEPLATVPVNHSTKATRYTWQSAPLTDRLTYRFVVRVAATPWPTGIETRNADARGATAGTSVPAAPTLAATVA